MTERIGSLEEFWPFYLSEHRDPTSRKLHFVGTTGFLASIVGAAVTNPIGFPLAAAGFAAVLKKGLDAEKDAPPFAHVAALLGLGTLASPVFFPVGVACAYGFAWAGHFGFEKNRPASWTYPLYSLTSDFKMYAHMLRGRLWSGEPLEELGLADPTVARESTPPPADPVSVLN
ncbi:MAG: DUF962 domain-containing protein [Sandaracinaceae bacterium]|nr:DUF962 domain-containing protein [Sandaracinaceae bacterium]